MSSTALVEVLVREVVPLQGRGRLIALASAELFVDGVAFVIHGIQVIETKDSVTGRAATGVDLPRYRDPSGAWRPAIDLPKELRKPLGDAVLDRCCQMGITRRVLVDA